MAELSRSGSRRHSRRSTGGSINFAQMSISPLTSTDLTEDHFSKSKSTRRPKTPTRNRSYHHTKSSSYLQGLSAPPTPGILAPSAFSFTPLNSGSSIPKSKSSTHLRKSSSRSSISADEWLHRTGAALSADAREYKGQSWLTTRDSSTSLKLSESSDEDATSDDDGDDTASQYYAASEHAHGAMTPMWAHTDDEGDPSGGMRRKSGEHLRNRTARSRSRGPSWNGDVGGDEDEDVNTEDEEEDEEYTRRHTFVIGQFIDRWIGWSIFGAEDDTEDEMMDEKEQTRNKRQQMIVRREPPNEEQLRAQRRRRDQTEDWQDPAWILSIATNLFM